MSVRSERSALPGAALTDHQSAQSVTIALRNGARSADRDDGQNRETPNYTRGTQHNRHLDPPDSRCTAADPATASSHVQGRQVVDIDELTGCADDQVFAAVPAELLRRIADA